MLILTFTIPAGWLLMVRHAQGVTFSTQPKDSEARCFGIYLPQAQPEPLAGCDHHSGSCLQCEMLLRAPQRTCWEGTESPTNVLVCFKLFWPDFVSLFASVPSKDLDEIWSLAGLFTLTQWPGRLASRGERFLTSQLTACFVSQGNLTTPQQLNISLWLHWSSITRPIQALENSS